MSTAKQLPRICVAGKLAAREFMARYSSVLRQVDYPMSSFFGERQERTASLLSMISCMISGNSGDSPEYVSQTAGKISRAMFDFKEQFEAADFAQEMKAMMGEVTANEQA